MNPLLVLGRLLFGGFFVYNGVNHFLQAEAMAGYAGSKKVPAPQIAVQASGGMLVLAGLSLALDVKPQIGAGLAAAFLLSVTAMMHRFWELESRAERQGEMINFMKNAALLGASLMLTQVQQRERPGDGQVDATMRELAVGE